MPVYIKLCKRNVRAFTGYKLFLPYLCNCLGRVFSTEFSINTLLHLIFTEFRCCLKQFKITIISLNESFEINDLYLPIILKMKNMCKQKTSCWKKENEMKLVPMLQGSAVPVAGYDQRVFSQLRVPAGQLQSYKHHSLNSSVQS